ncbi:MAG: hypothetical protein QW290_09000 [Sulfolobales archaeon]
MESMEKVKRLETRDLEEVVRIGRRHRQLGIYVYLLKKGQATLKEIYTVYNMFTKHRVRPETVKTQLRVLIGKGLIKEKGVYYIPVKIPFEASLDYFSFSRSRAGRTGAEKSFTYYLYRKLYDEEMPYIRDVNPKLRKKLRQVLETVKELIEKGDRHTALDIIAHTLLPVRKTGVLWLWWRDIFIYYESKPTERGIFHSVRAPALANLLTDLGYKEGLMIDHLKGISGRYLKKIFGKEDTYPYSRSLFYGLKKLGLAEEGPQFLLEIQYLNNEIIFTIKDIDGNILHVFRQRWEGAPPTPLTKEGDKRISITYGKQHIKAANESSYFSRF